MPTRTAIATAAALTLAPSAALAAVNLSIDQPIYTYASYDLAGNLIPNQISYSYPFGTPTADNDSTPYWTATTTFAEPSAGEKLFITQLRPDDRAVVLLNGVLVEAFGGLGPGLGDFVFTPGGPETSQLFQNNCCEGTRHLDIALTGPFVPGVNTLEFIVNNTNHGIFGPLADIGPSRLSFQGFISGTPPSSVPEPATWVMMGLGFAGLGLVGYHRRRPVWLVRRA